MLSWDFLHLFSKYKKNILNSCKWVLFQKICWCISTKKNLYYISNQVFIFLKVLHTLISPFPVHISLEIVLMFNYLEVWLSFELLEYFPSVFIQIWIMRNALQPWKMSGFCIWIRKSTHTPNVFMLLSCKINISLNWKDILHCSLVNSH